MLFWIVAALMTLAACMAVLLPLARAEPKPVRDPEHDLEVYRDQLAEVERDAARGLIGDVEAEEARTEISRRILKLAKAAEETREGRWNSAVYRWAALAAVLAVPVVSWGLYAALGSPGLPGQPLAQRMTRDPAQNSIEELVARAEAHLKANPQDGRGWDVLAPIYMRIGRTEDAVQAYRKAIELNGASAEREAGLGEALAARSGGAIGYEAVAAFRRALAIDGGNAKARYYLALADAQAGRTEDAAAAWRALAADAPADSPWRAAAAAALRQVEGREQAAVQGGPAQVDIEAAADMSAEERGAMIEAMVASLDERLRQNPQDREGWERLIRSYVVLGRQEEAREALARGVTALGVDTQAGQGLKQFAAALGVAAAETE